MPCGNAVRESLLLIKVEAESGTDITPAAADAIEVEGNIPDPTVDVGESERMVVNGGSVDGLSIVGSVKASIPLKIRLRGSGTAATPPKWTRLMQAMGFKSTATTDVDITPEIQCTTVSAYLYRGLKLHKLIGAAFVGTMTYDGAWFLEGTLTGKYVAVTAATFPASPVFDSGKFFNGLAPGFTYAGQTPILRSFSLDFGAQLAERIDLNDATGYAGFTITGYKPSFSMVIEDALISTYDWRALSLAAYPASAEAIAMGFGTGAGSVLSFALPNCRRVGYSEGNENGLATLECNGKMTDSAAGLHDWVTITTA